MNKLGFGGITGLLILVCMNAAQAEDAYLKEFNRAVQGVTQNILANGAVVASPSHANPDYYYDWVRDTSLTMKTLIKLSFNQTVSQALRADLAAKIDRWINWELNRQMVPKLTGLGEPKFYVNGSANNEPWGRPQNDSPALRALAGIELANHWIAEGRMSEVEARLYKAEIPANTLIKRDLEYVAANWSNSSYDLWEEERATHFYTLTVQKAALLKGADLASRMSDAGAAQVYLTQAKGVQNLMDQFYDSNQGVIKYAINKVMPLPHKKSDLDIAVILGAIQTFDGKFYANESQLQSTLNKLVAQFSSLYDINKNKNRFTGVPGIALGRYPDDKYSGFDFSSGNPWFIATLAAAEFYCEQAQVHFGKTKRFTAQAKAQFDRVLFHTSADGSLSEQFSRTSGYEQGAHDLTWSYTAYLTAYQACFH